ncbi:hypothetical protein FRB95_003277 [Tulasnella sp. JGI-2019a]|nr:hypothetical protein FRB95_003277 [Tulasnella sp. JGI-2019a]
MSCICIVDLGIIHQWHKPTVRTALKDLPSADVIPPSESPVYSDHPDVFDLGKQTPATAHIAAPEVEVRLQSVEQ